MVTQYGKYILIGIVLLLIGIVFWFFSNIIAYLVVSYVLSLIGLPLVRWMGRIKFRGFGISKSIRAASALFLIYAVLYFFLRLFVPIIGSQLSSMSTIDVASVVANLQGPIDRIEAYLSHIHVVNKSTFSIQNYIDSQIGSFMNEFLLANFFGSLVSFIGNIFIAFLSVSFMTFFFLKDEDLFANGLMIWVSSKHEDGVKHVLASTTKLLSRYFIGICLQVAGIILLTSIGLRITGLNWTLSITLGLIAGILNVIPYVGPIVSSILGFFIVIINNSQLDFNSQMMPLLMLMLIVYAIVHVIDNILFQPLIFSNSVSAHPLEIFILILIAGSLAGILGMLFAIPIYTILRVVAKEFFSNFRVVQKMTQRIQT